MYLRIRHLFNPLTTAATKIPVHGMHRCLCAARMDGLQTQNCHPMSSLGALHVVWQHWLLASAQPMLGSRLLFLSLLRIFYPCHFCHSSWDLNNDGTDLLSHGSTALRLQLLWSLVRASSSACGRASFLTYQRSCSEMTGAEAGSAGFAPGMLNPSSCKWIWDLFLQWPVTVPVTYNWCRQTSPGASWLYHLTWFSHSEINILQPCFIKIIISYSRQNTPLKKKIFFKWPNEFPNIINVSLKASPKYFQYLTFPYVKKRGKRKI